MITDNLKTLLLELYYQRGMLKKEIRSYEVSLWSLQDEFKTVLKWSDVEQKGRIENPKMTLNVDGTLKFSFSIPMYYRDKGKLVENPNWYNTENGNLMTSLRKVKVIFNKDEVDVENTDWQTVFYLVYMPKEYNGNVNLYNRKIVPAVDFVNAGYTNFDGTYGTIYSCSNSYQASDGIMYDVIFTPVAANGQVYSTQSINDYFNGIISNNTSIGTWLENDRLGRKLILSIFPVASTSDQWGIELHEMLAEWDEVRAKIGMLDSSNNPGNIHFDEPSYDYYRRYLRSVNTFEFVITSVTETHEKDILTCEIESEGLAFLELGKIGYKVNLSLANFELLHKDWYENHHDDEEPKQTLDYWCSEADISPLPDKVSDINSRAWYYDVRMNWNSFEDGRTRSSKKVYEESYTSSWNKLGSVMVPAAIESYREKARPVEIDKSNLYNITQTIAETFEIFCRYEFIYDENYHIIGRVIVFYNNFMNENDMLAILYPYSALKVSRNMDSTNTTTKLFILDPDNTTVESGQSSVMNAPPNASKEDYILNFDYMYTTGAINKELYDAIKPFEADMNTKNTALSAELLKLATYLTLKSELEGKKAVAEKSIEVDNELILQNNIKRNAITLDHSEGTNDGYIHITYKNPDYCLVRVDSLGRRYVTPAKTSTGINEDTIKIYASSSILANDAMSMNLVKSFMTEHDDYNNLTNIILQNAAELVPSTIDWDRVYEKLYTDHNVTIPTSCNVDLKNRPIVLSSTLVAAGYTVNNAYSYYTLYPLNFTTTVGTPNSELYDVICTPIMKDGTVRNLADIRSYIDNISTLVSSLTDWLDKDRQLSKLILDVLPHADNNINRYTSIENNQLHNWNKIKRVIGLVELPVPEDLNEDDKALINACKTTAANDNYVQAVYLTYNYDPHFYFDNIIETWESKANEDLAELDKYNEELGPKDPTDANFANGLYGKIKAAEDSVELQLQAKKLKIKEFEHLMGPALREGYWQPEHYDDYGDRKEIDTLSLTRPANNIKVDTGDSAIIAWDDELFDDEEKLYYQIGVNLKKIEYYPCIKLNDVFPQGIPTDLDKYSLVWWANNSIAFPGDSTAWDSIKDLTILGVGSLALVRYVKRDNVIEPVLVIVGAKNFSGEMLLRMILGTASTGGHARLEKYKVELASDKKSLVISHGTDNEIKTVLSEYWLCYHDTNNSVPNDWPLPIKDRYSTTNSKTDVRLVYPRIKFSSLALKTDSTNLKITYNDTKLEVGLDYRVLTRNTLRSGVYYPENFITIKPETLIKLGGTDLHLNINYLLSNMNTSIYLDAIKVSKENAYPKVSYEVSSNILNVNFVKTLYSKLAQIVMVNDTDLKFENTFGYISLLELDLDNCLNDTIEVKNYKTKFEDLFSTIVALTEAMKASGAGLTTALSGGIPLSEDGFAATLASLGDIMNAYIDSYLDDRSVVEDRIAEWLGEAGKIINGAQKSLNSTAIASINAYYALSGLAENVEAQLTSNVTRGPTRPDVFVTGDIWIRTKIDDSVNPPVEREIGRYVAIMSSDLVTDLTDETAGFSRTHDGSLASITGAAIDVDAEAGTIDMKAATNINMRSGGDIYIAANSNVDIIGNKKVNIGGTEINLCTLNEKIINDEGNLVPSGFKRETTGINLIAGEYTVDDKGIYNGHNSCILINPYKIDIRASDLKLKGSAITLLASEGTAANTSAVILDPNKGIYIGAGAGVTIWGGNNPAGISVYVGPVHSVKFRAGDYWIKTSNVSGHYEYDGENGTTFYSNYILSSGEMTDLFTIQLIYCATNNYDDPDLGTIAKNNTVGWAIAKNNNGNNMSASRANAVKVIQENGPNGALIELNKDHLLFGYSNIKNKKSTAIELTEKHLIIAAGKTKLGEDVSENNQLKVTGEEPVLGNHSLVGAMLTEESIGFATLSGAGSTADPYVFTAIIMNKKGVTLGATDGSKDLAAATSDELKEYFKSSDHGSYVRVAADGIELGSLADLYVNTDNFKLLTHSRDKEDENPNFIDGNTVLAVGSNLLSIGYNTTATVDGNNVYHFYNGNTIIKNNNNVEPTVQLLLNNQGLYISGNGSFTGVVSASSFVAHTHYTVNNNDKVGVFKVTGGEMGFYKFENPNNFPNNWNTATKMLYFNTDTGDLYIAGTLLADDIYIKEGNKQRKSWKKYFQDIPLDYMTTVEATIKGIWDEAGDIMSEAGAALATTHSLTLENNTILAHFLAKAKDLNPTVTSSKNVPTTFKPGDLWTRLNDNDEEIGTYTAYAYSTERPSGHTDSGGFFWGWNRTYDGSLASITGAGIKEDAVAGTLDLYAGSKISLKAKSLLDLAAGDIQITGNYSINIGSKWINIGSANGGINIISTNIDNNTTTGDDGKVGNTVSKVQLDRNGIVMHSSYIEIMAGNTDTVSTLTLDPSKGVWIGSGKEIRFFSGTGVPSDTTGANVVINRDKIHLGVSAGSSATALVITDTQILAAAGDVVTANSTNNTNITATSNIVGVQIKKDYIGMAMGTTANRSLVSIKPNQVLIGVANNATDDTIIASGAYIKITNDNIASFEVGSTGRFSVLTPSMMLDNNTANGTTNLYIANNTSWDSATSGIRFITGSGLSIKGNVYATGFEIDPNANVDLTNFTGMTIADWGADWSGVAQKYLMIQAGDKVPGGIICGSTDGIARNFVIPWIPDPEHAPNGAHPRAGGVFTTPAFLINKDGLEYRYMTDDGTGAPTLPLNYVHINSNGIEMVGNNIAIQSGHITVNGEQVWERGDILYGENEPANHPAYNWIWIKPNGNIVVSKTFTSSNLSASNLRVRRGNIGLTARDHLTTSSLNIMYTVTINFTSVQGFLSDAHTLYFGFSNTETTPNLSEGHPAPDCPLKGEMQAVVHASGSHSASKTFESSVNVLPTEALMLYMIAASGADPNNITITSVLLEASVPGIDGTRVLCDVFYYPPPQS